MPHDPGLFSILRLTMTPGLGPVLIRRAIEEFGSPEAVLAANESGLKRIKGIGIEKARTIAAGLRESERAAEDELGEAERSGTMLLAINSNDYPPLLRQIPDPPPILYVRGRLAPGDLDRYPVAIVGSRSCTHYGIEQAERFAGALAAAGLTVVSGGARGIDTAAHRAALRMKGRTIAVLGCGLSHIYPPDNRELFEQIVEGGGGAVVGELPMRTVPDATNFPARNRIISGLSLGVLVIEAGRGSGALITARGAVEDQGREVFAVPGRVDSAASMGCLDLLRAGGAELVMHPDDVIQSLETPARHLYQGTHESRYATGAGLFEVARHSVPGGANPAQREGQGEGEVERAIEVDANLTETQRAILAALESAKTFDELVRDTQIPAAALRTDISLLEIKRRVKREGSRVVRAR
ncbi:MAG: DNA-processing protein DprA [Phycisphaeraceae bacterium]|nr:DNA-processing protein DprA [Phycisphaeraceae bacterium]